MRPMSNSKDGSRPSSKVPTLSALGIESRPALAPILLTAPMAASMLSISRRAFHALRKRSDFPQDATVVLGTRCVRFRLEVLQAYAQTLSLVTNVEDVRLLRMRDDRRGQRRSSVIQEPDIAVGNGNVSDRPGDNPAKE